MTLPGWLHICASQRCPAMAVRAPVDADADFKVGIGDCSATGSPQCIVYGKIVFQENG